MDAYVKGDTIDVHEKLPYTISELGGVEDSESDALKIVHVKHSANVTKLVAYTIKHLLTSPATRVILRGVGRSCTKTISCAEVLKREYAAQHTADTINVLHQITRVSYQRSDDNWTPTSADTNLDDIRVRRHEPCVCILFTRDQSLNVDNVPGYQNGVISRSTNNSRQQNRVAYAPHTRPQPYTRTNQWMRGNKKQPHTTYKDIFTDKE